MDLGAERLPFEDNSVELIFSYHCLEHVPDLLFCLGEMNRVLKHNGLLLLGVPYLTLTQHNLVNPYHLHNFNEYFFDLFDPDVLLGSAVEEGIVAFRSHWHRFHYMPPFSKLPFKALARRHLMNVVNKIDFGVYALKNDEPIVRFNESALFDECCRSRVRYAAEA